MTFPGRPHEPGRMLGAATVTGIMAASELRNGTVIAERFRVDSLLGMGGMGVVYRARDLELGIDVALKLLRPELASRSDAFDRFRQELLLARQVSSPHVVRIHDLVRHGDAWMISMDLVDGESLEQRLQREGALEPATALQLARQIALGLDAAHHRGVVHRDLKPANILITSSGEARITDFGVARSAGATGITGSGIIIGTPEYLSPEQARAEPIDGRSDLYALGLILYEMLTGTLPFRGGTPAEMLAQRLFSVPPAANSLRPGLPDFSVRLCNALLQTRASARPQSAHDVVRAIDGGRLPGARSGTRPRRGRSAILGVTAALLLIGLVATPYYLGNRPEWRAAPTPELVAEARAPVLAILPWTGPDDDAARATVEAAWPLLTVQSQELLGARIRDSSQVLRAMRELDFDAEAARRHPVRLHEVLEADHLLQGRWQRDEGSSTLTLALVNASDGRQLWSASSSAVEPDQLGREAAALLAGMAAIPEWRTLEQLDDTNQTAAVGDTSQPAANDAAAASESSAVWWLRLAEAETARSTDELARLARLASERFADDPQRGAQRVAAYAELLLGENPRAAERLAELLEQANDPPLRRLRARALGEAGRIEEAAAELRLLLRDDPRDAVSWYALGRYSIIAGDAQPAVDDYLVRALVQANRQALPALAADATNALGVGFRSLGQLDAAEEHFARAAGLRREVGDIAGVAVSQRNRSTILAMQGRFDEAAAALDDAEALLLPTGNRAALADLTNDRGVLAEERGDFRQALLAYREALGHRQAGGDTRLIGESLINVGFSYLQMGQFDNAQVYMQQAIAAYASIDDSAGSVRAALAMAPVLVALGDFAAARENLQESLLQAEARQMSEEHAVALAGLAELDHVEGQIEQALVGSQAAEAIFEQRQDPRGTQQMRLLRAAALLDIGALESARAELQQAEAAGFASVEQQAEASLLSGLAALQAADPDALQLAQAATSLSDQAGSVRLAIAAGILEAEVLHGLGRSAQARTTLAAAAQRLGLFSSAVLRLRLAEAASRIGSDDADARYREARVLLARLPAYVRAFHLHQARASASAPGSAEAARTDADAALAELRKGLSPPHAEALQDLVERMEQGNTR